MTKKVCHATQPITLADLAADKCFPVDYLKTIGVDDLPGGGVLIRYHREDGSLADRHRSRQSLIAKAGSLWWPPRGKKPAHLYGENRLAEIRERGSVTLVCGETDVWTLQYYGYPVLGIPGDNMTRLVQQHHLECLDTVYIYRKPGDAGELFVRNVANRIRELGFPGDIRLVHLDGVTDPNEFHIRDPKSFDRYFGRLLEWAVSVDISKPDSATSRRTPPILSPGNPIATARQFCDELFVESGTRTLHFQHGEFYAWNGRSYPRMDVAWIKSKIYLFLETAKCCEKEKGVKSTRLVDFKPNRHRVDDVVDSLKAIAHLKDSVLTPSWLGATYNIPPSELVACANGLLHLPSGVVLPSTPLYFNHNAIPIDFNPNLPPPTRWLSFLDDIFGGNADAIGLLQEVMGYLLSVDTSQQKIFLIVGPKRAGKGTIARILMALVGSENVCSPTLSSLSATFGLAPLIGRQLAIISDARIGGRTDQHTIAERLLTISGENDINVDRKFLNSLDVRLTSRFLFLTNALPRISDASGALASRFVILTLRNSYYGREDTRLTDRLLEELSAILNWTIAGWRRLRDRGHFPTPSSSQEAMQILSELGSPILAFLTDCCEIGDTYEVECGELFSAWKSWCQTHGHDHTGTTQSFGRDLHAAAPAVSTDQRRYGKELHRDYAGIRLRR